MVNSYALIRPLLHCLPAETAHHLAIAALRGGVLPASSYVPPPALQVQAFGLSFKTPLGLAAGFDKNAEVINPVLAQGFAFAEAGTVTPLAQQGNAKPRIFRLPEDRAVINRLGFNNKGLEYFCDAFARRNPALGIAGANIGKNRDSSDAIGDYVTGLKAVYPLADYVTVNISSPNTKGLRDLQQRDPLDGLLSALAATRKEYMAAQGRRVPLLLKIAPDIDAQQAEDIAAVVVQHGFDGVIVSNTTLARPGWLASSHAQEEGGLSGVPLYERSTELLRMMYTLTQGKIPLVGVGGINSAEAAYAKMRAGATLLQLYTALVYDGFSLVRRIHEGLEKLLQRDGFSSVQQAVGSDHC